MKIKHTLSAQYKKEKVEKRLKHKENSPPNEQKPKTVHVFLVQP